MLPLLHFVGSVLPCESGLVCWRPDGEAEGDLRGATGNQTFFFRSQSVEQPLTSASKIYLIQKIGNMFPFIFMFVFV